MAGITVGTPVSMVGDGQGALLQVSLTAAAAAGDATTVVAAATGKYHQVHGLTVDTDTAGETIALKDGTTTLTTVRMVVPDLYVYRFSPPIQCSSGTALVLDKGTVGAIQGLLHYSTVASGENSGAVALVRLES
jgi:hypothetical protein